MIKNGQDLIIVGFGPAGLGTVLPAHHDGYERIVTIDPSEKIGSGGLTGLGITSNSPGKDFTEPYETYYPKVLEHVEAAPLHASNTPVDLRFASSFLKRAAADVIADGLVNHVPERALQIHLRPNGFHVKTQTQEFDAPKLVLAPGAVEEIIPELDDRDPSLVFTSREILAHERSDELGAKLARRPHVAVVGNSHGAYSVVDEVLDRFPEAKIDIYKQSPTKPYFESVEEAERHGYGVSSLDSVCPDTGIVNRYFGVRGRARTVWFQEQALGHEQHLQTKMNIPVSEIGRDVPIIQATGYKPRKLSLFGEDGSPLDYETKHEAGGFASVVVDGSPLKGVFALGLGHSKFDGTNAYPTQARLALSLDR